MKSPKEWRGKGGDYAAANRPHGFKSVGRGSGYAGSGEEKEGEGGEFRVGVRDECEGAKKKIHPGSLLPPVYIVCV